MGTLVDRYDEHDGMSISPLQSVLCGDKDLGRTTCAEAVSSSRDRDHHLAIMRLVEWEYS